MKIILVRHAESIGNTLRGYISGQSDKKGLTKLGQLQILKTACNLSDLKILSIYSSPVARAKESSLILGRVLNVKPHFVDFLSELSYGQLEGKYWYDIKPLKLSIFHIWKESFDTPYPEGESIKMLYERVFYNFEKLVKKLDKHGTYVFVSHQAVLNILKFLLTHSEDQKKSVFKNYKYFLNFFHNQDFKNAQFCEFDKAGNNVFIEAKKRRPKKLSVKKQIEKYSVAILKLKKPINIHKQMPASTNEVFKISSFSKSYLFKALPLKNSEFVKKQANIFNYLSIKKIKAPKIITLDVSRIYFKDTVIVTDYVDGMALHKILKKKNQRLLPIFENIYKNINSVHQFPVNEVSDFWTPPKEIRHEEFSKFMLHNIVKITNNLSFLVNYEPLRKKIEFDLLTLKRYFELKKFKVVPIHSDLNTNNIIVSGLKNPKFLRIIDFEWASMGDPLWDFSYFWGFLERDSPEYSFEFEKFINKKMPTDFEMMRLYKVLFHTWAIQDFYDFKNDKIIKLRKQKSENILKNSKFF